MRGFVSIETPYQGLQTAGLGKLYLAKGAEGCYHGVGTIPKIFGKTVVEVLFIHDDDSKLLSVCSWVPEGVKSGDQERFTHPGLLKDTSKGLHDGPRRCNPDLFPVDCETLDQPSSIRTIPFCP